MVHEVGMARLKNLWLNNTLLHKFNGVAKSHRFGFIFYIAQKSPCYTNR
jgi:hypothetical protein